MAGIKPCPFCGSTEIEYKQTYTGGGESHGVMRCLECGCTVPTSEFGKRVKEPYSEWNRRYGECDRKALVGLAECLESYADGAASPDGYPYVNAGELWSFADTIREAIGEEGQ